MKVVIHYDDGTNEEFDVLLEGVGVTKAIEITKEFIANKKPPETRKVKSFEAEEAFL